MNRGLQKLVDGAFEHHARFRDRAFLARPSVPVLYFGDRHAYESSQVRVLTVGLNPSHVEFPSDNPYLRFPGADTIDPRNYLASLNRYFRTAPYTRWFNPAFEPLLNGLGSSYYDGHQDVALHTDLCSPLATNPTWSKLDRTEREEMQMDGVRLWHDLVRYLRPHVILVSIARKYLELLEFSVTDPCLTLHTVRRENPYVVRAARYAIDGETETLVVFGQAAQLPFGTIDKSTKTKIGTIVLARYEQHEDHRMQRP